MERQMPDEPKDIFIESTHPPKEESKPIRQTAKELLVIIKSPSRNPLGNGLVGGD